MGGGGSSSDGDDPANIEISPEQAQTIRRMVAENKALTGPLIENLRQTDPQGAAHLTPDDPDGILRYFSELGNESGAPSDGSNSNVAPARIAAPPPRGNGTHPNY
jgi:hypothetical protein